MTADIVWSCNFCGKSGIVVSLSGILYCRQCRMSYGEQLTIRGDMMLFKCGHKNDIEEIESMADPISYLDWLQSVGPEGTKEECWECYTSSCATVVRDEE